MIPERIKLNFYIELLLYRQWDTYNWYQYYNKLDIIILSTTNIFILYYIDFIFNKKNHYINYSFCRFIIYAYKIPIPIYTRHNIWIIYTYTHNIQVYEYFTTFMVYQPVQLFWKHLKCIRTTYRYSRI